MSKKNKNKHIMDQENKKAEAKCENNAQEAKVEDKEKATAGKNAVEEGKQAADKEAAEQLQADNDAETISKLKAELEEKKKDYLFLMADFDNYRKRTLKEKADLIKNGAEGALRELLPVIDDFERALEAIEKGGDLDSLKEGVQLIYNKFVKYLEKNQVKPIESTGKDFDTDLHEAVTTFPAADEKMKGKVIDTVQKGYTINDKVLRHAKVVVGK